MLLRSIRSQYVDPEQVHELLIKSLEGTLTVTDSGRTLLATSKGSTSIISFLADSTQLINALLVNYRALPNAAPPASSAVTARLASSSLFLHTPSEPSLLAVVFAISDVVVLSSALPAALLAEVERLAIGNSSQNEISDFPSLVLCGDMHPDTASLRRLFPGEIVQVAEISDLPRLAGVLDERRRARLNTGHSGGVSLVQKFEKLVAAVNGGRGVNLFALGRATQREALDKAAFWTRKILTRESRKFQEQLPLGESEISRASATLRDLALKEWRKWAPWGADESEISIEISGNISDLVILNTRTAEVHNEAVLQNFAERISVENFDEAVQSLRGDAATVHKLQLELVRLALQAANSDQEVCRLKQEHSDMLTRLQAEAAKSAAVMTAAEFKISAYLEEIHVFKTALDEATAETARWRVQAERPRTPSPPAEPEPAISALHAEISAVTNEKNVLASVLEVEKRAVEVLEEKLRASEARAASAALQAAQQPAPREEAELRKTVEALEAQLRETREALAEEQRRSEAQQQRRSEAEQQPKRRTLFGCLSRPRVEN